MPRGVRPGAGLTAYGFQSSVTDWAAEMGYPRDVVRAALSHAVRDATEAAYLRTDHLDARRPLMAAWADYCFGRKPAGITRKLSLAVSGSAKVGQWSGGVVRPRGGVITGHWLG